MRLVKFPKQYGLFWLVSPVFQTISNPTRTVVGNLFLPLEKSEKGSCGFQVYNELGNCKCPKRFRTAPQSKKKQPEKNAVSLANTIQNVKAFLREKRRCVASKPVIRSQVSAKTRGEKKRCPIDIQIPPEKLF